MVREKGPWKVLDTKIVYKNRWMEVKEDKVIRPNGEEGIYTTARVSDGVAFLPLDSEGNVYLERQYRYAVEQDCLEVPSGFRDQGENALEAAKRELKEELGIEAEKWTDLGKTYLATGYVENDVPLFLAESLTFGTPSPDDGEELVPVKMKFSEAVDRVMDGTITNIMTITIILKANEYLRRRDGKA